MCIGMGNRQVACSSKPSASPAAEGLGWGRGGGGLAADSPLPETPAAACCPPLDGRGGEASEATGAGAARCAAVYFLSACCHAAAPCQKGKPHDSEFCECTTFVCIHSGCIQKYSGQQFAAAPGGIDCAALEGAASARRHLCRLVHLPSTQHKATSIATASDFATNSRCASVDSLRHSPRPSGCFPGCPSRCCSPCTAAHCLNC